MILLTRLCVFCTSCILFFSWLVVFGKANCCALAVASVQYSSFPIRSQNSPTSVLLDFAQVSVMFSYIRIFHPTLNLINLRQCFTIVINKLLLLFPLWSYDLLLTGCYCVLGSYCVYLQVCFKSVAPNLGVVISRRSFDIS